MTGTMIDVGLAIRITVAIGVVAAAATAVTLLIGGAAPSQAAGHERCFTDPEGDVRAFGGAPTDEGRADIVEVCATYEPGALTFSVRAVDDVNPVADPAWQAGDAFVIWGIRADAAAYGGPTGQVFMNLDGGALSVVATWFDDGTPVCAGAGVYEAPWYRATFDPACLDVPSTIAFNAYAEYDGAFDVAPEGEGREGIGRFAGPLTRDGVAPPADRLAGRFFGPTRIETAVDISRSQFPHGAEEVYLARADDFPDALAGGALTRGPILLVPQCGTLPQVVGFEIERLDPERVIALGGTAAVCDTILQQARDR
jgi:hypothetical protein